MNEAYDPDESRRLASYNGPCGLHDGNRWWFYDDPRLLIQKRAL
jgi:hypothetical protein